METAIRNFQSFAGLPVTGELDAATIKQMKEPRCGMSDVDEEGRVKRYKGLFTWTEEDPSTRKILEGETTFRLVYMQKFWSGWLLKIK